MKNNKIVNIAIIILCIIASIVNIMSIVNIGIKHKGVNEIIPKIITAEHLDAIKALSKNEDLYKDFRLEEKSTDKKTIEKYPIMELKNVYFYEGKSNKKLENDIMKYEAFLWLSKPMFAKINYSVNSTTVKLFTTLGEQNEIKDLYKSIDDMSKSKLKKYAKEYVLSEYENYKMNLKSTQNKYMIPRIILQVIIFAIMCISIFFYINKVLKKKEA